MKRAIAALIFLSVLLVISVIATTAAVTRNITVTQSGNGTISPKGTSGTVKVVDGKSRSFKIMPKSGYYLVSVMVDNADVEFKKSGRGGVYTFKNVTADHSIAAEISISPKLTVANSGRGVVKGVGISCGKDCAQQFDPGKTVNLTAIPAKGFAFNIWENCTADSKNPKKCNLTISSDVTVSAIFKDTTKPTTPKNLSATATSGSNITLTWMGSADNFSDVSYSIYRDGVAIANTTNNNVSDDNLEPGTEYCYTVQSIDEAGNVSADSATKCATTRADDLPTWGLSLNLSRSGWSETMLYEHPIVYPQNIFLNSDSNIIVYSRGNKKFIEYSGGIYSSVYDASLLSAIYGTAWQPNAGRIIFNASDGCLYALTGGSRSKLAGPSVALGNIYAIAVDTEDDTFYTCSMTQGQSVYRWNASGTSSTALATNTHGCSSIALDKANNKLYFSETYDGEINELDLSDNSITVIATGVGIAGTFEPIAVALDAGGDLYSFPGASGLFKYTSGTSWMLKAAPIAGAGPLLWYPDANAFVTGNGVGSNLTKYDPSNGSATNLTEYINATGIAQNSSGDVLLCDQNFGTKIKKATTSGLSDFATLTGTVCNTLENDPNGVIYAGMTNSEIWKVADNGTAAAWATGYSSFPVMGIAWDEANQRLIAVTGDNATSTAYVYGIPGANPAGASLIATMAGVTTGGSVPDPAVDENGNIYLIERAANKIYKIASGTSTLTDFATSVLDSAAITVPRIEYVSAESALLVSTISTYELWPIDGGRRITFGTNNGGVDNFGINQAPDGSVLAIHSGRIFRLTHN